MTIPVRNLYYMFLYAWARFPVGAIRDVGIDDSPDLPSLFSRLLLTGTHNILRRGLDRGYKTFTDELVGARGRLRFERMVKGATQLRGTAICDFDELTHDVLHNQILKATARNLAACSDLDREMRQELLAMARQLHDVEDIRLSSSCFSRIAVSRNNGEYGFLMRVCEFIFRSLMPDEIGARARFQAVLEDEVRMSTVFEEFLRNFYKAHRTEYRVRAEMSEWCVGDATMHDLALLPRMLTDITLRHSDHTIIIDAKFYKKALSQSRYGERVRSDHLYQLLTYLQHERTRDQHRDLAGVLIYPAVGQSLRLRYRLLGIPVLVATVDLGRSWRDVEIELNTLLDEVTAIFVGGRPFGIPRQLDPGPRLGPAAR